MEKSHYAEHFPGKEFLGILPKVEGLNSKEREEKAKDSKSPL